MREGHGGCCEEWGVRETTQGLGDLQPWRGEVQLGETGGLVWGRVPTPPTFPPRPRTYLLLNVCQRLDGQISKGGEGLVAGVDQTWTQTPTWNLIPSSLSLSQYLPGRPLPLPATASSHQHPAAPLDSPFQTPSCPPVPTLGLRPPLTQKRAQCCRLGAWMMGACVSV